MPDVRAQLRSIEDGLKSLGMVPATTPRGGVSGPLVRRRGRSLGPADDKGVIRLIRQNDGLLVWHAGPVGHRTQVGRRSRRATGGATPPGEVVEMFQYDLLTRNQINDLVIRADDVLTGKELGLLRLDGNAFKPVEQFNRVAPKRLLIVHGTFSNTARMLAGADRSFLDWARQTYPGEVYAFDHRTLSVSPMVNALDLWRTLRNVTGGLDIVAHSRGGLVVRWLLEVLGLELVDPVRVVLVGSPLGGTSLAAPQHLRNTLSAIGSFASAVSHASAVLAQAATPWLSIPAMIVQIASSILGKAADLMSRLPILDAVISMIPGLAAQARIDGNAELSRLRAGPARFIPLYFGVKSNFEPSDPGWAFWKRLRIEHLAHSLSDGVFPSENDMVVDTGSMFELGSGSLFKATHDYGTNPNVHHLNYFAQPSTTSYISQWLPRAI